MMMGILAVLMIASVPLTGGSLRALLHLPIRSGRLLPLALFLQVLVINIIPGAPQPFPLGVHLFTYLLAAAFLVRNWQIPGIPLLALGGLMNGAAIAANDGTLPASAKALRRAGLSDDGGFLNSAVLPHPHLAWLGDNFAIGSSVPFANVFSLGDVVILLGALVILHRGSRPPQEQQSDHSAHKAAI